MFNGFFCACVCFWCVFVSIKKLVGHYGTWSYIVLDISPNRGYDDHVSVCYDMNGVNWQSQLNGFHILKV